MTNHQQILKYIEEFDSIVPAKMGGKFYKDQIFPSEAPKRCRELRAKKLIYHVSEGKYKRFFLTEKGKSYIENGFKAVISSEKESEQLVMLASQ